MAVKQLVEYRPGDTDNRPWGRWTVLSCGQGYVVKEIVVRAGQSLSLQAHHFRHEHWVIINGEAKVTVGDRMSYLRRNDSVAIPANVKHRIANDGESELCFIEVQTGPVLAESDVYRYEDHYGRAGVG